MNFFLIMNDLLLIIQYQTFFIEDVYQPALPEKI